MLKEFHFFQNFVDLFIVKLIERVQVFSDGALDNEWHLRDVSNTLTQLVQSNLLDVNAVNFKLSFAAV